MIQYYARSKGSLESILGNIVTDKNYPQKRIKR